MEIIVDHPAYLYFLLGLPILIISHYLTLKYVRGRVLQFANFETMARISGSMFLPRNILQLIIRIFMLAFIIFAVAGMNYVYFGTGANSDYVLAVDISSSMLADDLFPTRLAAAKQSAQDFIDLVPERTKLGLVSFSGTAFVEQQMTEDKEMVKEKVESLNISSIGGTDLGEAIITSSTQLISTENTKAVILLTDGRSNVGVSVADAIAYANTNEVQIFTIAVGTVEGGELEGLPLTLDVEMLTVIANETGGEFFMAENKEQLDAAYRSIVTESDRKIIVNLTPLLLFSSLFFSFADWILLNSRYRRIP